MTRCVLRAFLSVGLGCQASQPEGLSAPHAAAMRDSVATFLEAHAALMSTYPIGEEGRAVYHDSVIAAVDIVPDRPLVLSGYRALAGEEARPAWLRAFAFAYDSTWITPLAPGVAVVAATYRERFVDTTGATTSLHAAASLVVQHGPRGWRIRHFASSHPDSASAAYHRLMSRMATQP